LLRYNYNYNYNYREATTTTTTTTTGREAGHKIGSIFSHGHPVYMICFASLIIFFAFFYTALMFNPNETSENLRKMGNYIPGVRPGKPTAEYLDYVLTRLTVVGALFLASIQILFIVVFLCHFFLVVPQF